jgi:hypothetical protein
VASDDLLTERLLRVVDEGRRTATYKLALLLALLLALIDAAAEHVTRWIARLRDRSDELTGVDATGPIDLVL